MSSFYTSDENFSEGVGTRACNVGLGRVEGDVEDALVELLPMRGDLLNTSLCLKVPQPNTAIVTCKQQREKCYGRIPSLLCLTPPPVEKHIGSISLTCLRKAFTCTDPERAKMTVKSTYFALLKPTPQ